MHDSSAQGNALGSKGNALGSKGNALGSKGNALGSKGNVLGIMARWAGGIFGDGDARFRFECTNGA